MPIVSPGLGIYKRKMPRKEERKYAFVQEKSKIQRKKERNTISTKKKRKKQDHDQE